MTVPAWIASILVDFGKGAGIPSLEFNERGTAAISFENGQALRFEYVGGALVVAMTVPAYLDPDRAKELFFYSHPDATLGFKVRTGYLARRGAALFAVKIDERAVTLPALNQAFSVLWRIAREFGGAE